MDVKAVYDPFPAKFALPGSIQFNLPDFFYRLKRIRLPPAHLRRQLAAPGERSSGQPQLSRRRHRRGFAGNETSCPPANERYANRRACDLLGAQLAIFPKEGRLASAALPLEVRIPILGSRAIPLQLALQYSARRDRCFLGT